MDYIKLTTLDLDFEHQLLQKYRAQLDTLPRKNMICKQIRGKNRYYLSDGKKRHYIPQSKASLVNDIKTAHYLEKAISIIESNIILQKKLLQRYRPYDFIYVNRQLPNTYKLSPETAPDMQVQEAEARLIHRTSFGLYVRSKSEALIAEVLHAENIPFEYELPLWLQEADSQIKIRPDFTIPTPSGPVYWEHMGMIGEENYRDGALQRLALYCENGITIPDGLMVTMDTCDGAIDMFAIKLLADSIKKMHGL